MNMDHDETIVVAAGKANLELVMRVAVGFFVFGALCGLFPSYSISKALEFVAYTALLMLPLVCLAWAFRSGAWLDLAERQLVTWSIMKGRRRETRTPLSEFESVAVVSESRQSANKPTSYTVYTVVLEGRTKIKSVQYRSGQLLPPSQDEERVYLYGFRDKQKAIESARSLSKKLGLSLNHDPLYLGIN